MALKGREALWALVARFATDGEVVAIEPVGGGGGHINESHVVTCRRGDRSARFLLQRLNPAVFPDPHRVMENVARVTEHLAQALALRGVAAAARRALRLVPTRDGTAWVADDRGDVWRLYWFIEGAVARREPADAVQAERAGLAFGWFQRLLADLPGPRLHETIPDFHHTPRRLDALEGAVERDAANRAAVAREEIARARTHRTLAGIILEAAASGDVPERVVHNDAKISNVLFDAATGEALCVVDLDTVMPGFALYDFGDLVRSAATRAAEDETDLARVRLEPELFDAITRGYLAATGDVLSAAERRLLVAGAEVIVYEQAIRFLTDYLEGDRYYRVARPNHNLDRCRAQLALLGSLLDQERVLARIVARV